MKKLLITASTLLILLNYGTMPVHAQSSCDSVSSDSSYTNCCTGPAPQGDPNTCLQYKAKACNSITNDTQYSMCGCTGGVSDSSSCVGYAATKSPSVQGQLGSTSANPSAISLTPVNSNTSQTFPGLNPQSSSSNSTTCTAQFKTLLDIAIWIKCIIGAVIIPGIFMLAFVIFLWGVIKFMRSSDQKDKQDSKQFIIMGLIGLFVMVSVWGIIRILSVTLGIQSVVPALQTDYLSKSGTNTTTTPTSTSTGSN
jgi:hypothetical protein